MACQYNPLARKRPGWWLPSLLLAVPAQGLADTGLGPAEYVEHKVIASDGAADDRFGSSVSGAGDVNGDGYPDVVVGAPYDDDQGVSSGSIYVYYGSSAGFWQGAEEKLIPSDGGTSNTFGFTLSGAGDVNGDGHDDLIVGANGHTHGGVTSGAAYVLLGSGSGIQPSGELEIIPSDGANGDSFGYAVSGAGDVDGDGYADVLIGAHGVDDLGITSGAAYLYYGSSVGLPLLSEQKLYAWDAMTDDAFGRAVSGAGDVNGDGYADLLVGADGDDDNGSFSGSVYVFYGAVSGVSAAAQDKLIASDGATDDLFGRALAAAGDVDGDGLGDVLVGAFGDERDGPQGGSAYVYYGAVTGISALSEDKLEPSDGAARDCYAVAVAGAGDVNGDGLDDLLIGAYWDDDDGFNSGTAWVYYGTLTGISQASGDKLTTGDARSGEQFGTAVAGGGDLDGDGFADLLVGIPGDGNNGSSSGSVSAFAGGCRDEDADGACAYADCDDSDPAVGPSAAEQVADGVDSDCDGFELCYADADADGYTDGTTTASPDLDCDGAGEAPADAPDGDCDDTDPSVWPGAPEAVGDEVDSDCDGRELCYADADDDGYTGGETVESADTGCRDPGEATASDPDGDCDDQDPTRNPGATEEIDDGTDSDCDGLELCYADADADGFTSGATTTSADPDCLDPGEASSETPPGDCDDADATVYPGAAEIPGDGIDQDCDGVDAEEPAEDDTGFSGDKGGGCGACASQDARPGLQWLALLGALTAWRRRRSCSS
ncbi:MAG: FG-GAP repeat protein [Alphaproteobacteria bacterium]|nr:FG-GAP repeat protein [Alphaproteobacteria bacterium]